MKDLTRRPESGKGEIVIYQPDDVTRLEVRVDEDTVWLTQSQIADLFGRDRSIINVPPDVLC